MSDMSNSEGVEPSQSQSHTAPKLGVRSVVHRPGCEAQLLCRKVVGSGKLFTFSDAHLFVPVVQTMNRHNVKGLAQPHAGLTKWQL
jgi:hypothetical protein